MGESDCDVTCFAFRWNMLELIWACLLADKQMQSVCFIWMNAAGRSLCVFWNILFYNIFLLHVSFLLLWVKGRLQSEEAPLLNRVKLLCCHLLAVWLLTGNKQEAAAAFRFHVSHMVLRMFLILDKKWMAHLKRLYSKRTKINNTLTPPELHIQLILVIEARCLVCSWRTDTTYQ